MEAVTHKVNGMVMVLRLFYLDKYVVLSVSGVTCFHVNGTCCNIYHIIMDSNVIMCACLVGFAEKRVIICENFNSFALLCTVTLWISNICLAVWKDKLMVWIWT